MVIFQKLILIHALHLKNWGCIFALYRPLSSKRPYMLKAVGLFKYAWPFCWRRALKGYPFSTWYPLKGQTYLNKPAAKISILWSCRLKG